MNKLTAAQTRILQYLADGGTITQNWMSSTVWRYDDKKPVHDLSITRLMLLRYIDIESGKRVDTMHITAEGRAAIAQPADGDGDAGTVAAPVSDEPAESNYWVYEVPAEVEMPMLRRALHMCQLAMIKHGNDTNWDCGLTRDYADATNAARAALNPGKYPEFAHFFDEVEERD